MRKLFWCCTAASALAAGGFLSTVYYACSYPDSPLGRVGIVALQPILKIAAWIDSSAATTNGTPGSVEIIIPAEPQPILQAAKPSDNEPSEVKADLDPNNDTFAASAPIVIPEEDPIVRSEPTPIAPSTIDMEAPKVQEMPGKVCSVFMPYCQDDDGKATPPSMPYAKDNEVKPAKQKPTSEEESEQNVFKAWMKVWQDNSSKGKEEQAEELPFPQEEPQAAPRCQEDGNLHEHYPGCPHMSCPQKGKSSPAKSSWKKPGKEESSEEPAHKAKLNPDKQCPRTQGVDTMEYRKSDGGLNEYGTGPYH